MNKEDIIRMAREAEYLVIEDYYTNGPVRAFSEAQLERFATLVAAAERERLAKVFDERDKDIGWYDPGEPAEIIRGQA